MIKSRTCELHTAVSGSQLWERHPAGRRTQGCNPWMLCVHTLKKPYQSDGVLRVRHCPVLFLIYHLGILFSQCWVHTYFLSLIQWTEQMVLLWDLYWVGRWQAYAIKSRRHQIKLVFIFSWFLVTGFQMLLPRTLMKSWQWQMEWTHCCVGFIIKP